MCVVFRPASFSFVMKGVYHISNGKCGGSVNIVNGLSVGSVNIVNGLSVWAVLTL